MYTNLGAQKVNKALNDYWARIAENYYVPDVFGRRMLQAYLLPLKPKSLIEVGCGSGELFSIYKDIQRVVAVDWQPKMLKRSRERIERHGYMNIELGLEPLDITNSYFNERFDVALTRTVLMHIDPKDIKEACRNLTFMTDRIIAFEYFKPGSDALLARHNWHHDYPSIFEELGFKMVDAYERQDGIPQILFHFIRDEYAQNSQGSAGTAVARSIVSASKDSCNSAS